MLTNYAKDSILRALLGKAPYVTLASDCYLGLLQSVTVAEDGSVEFLEADSEYTAAGGTKYDTGYARVQLGSANDQRGQKMSVNNGAATNDDAIFVCECLGHPEIEGYPDIPWGTCPYFGIFSGKTGGTLLAYDKILNKDGQETPIEAHAEQVPVIRKNQLNINID